MKEKLPDYDVIENIYHKVDEVMAKIPDVKETHTAKSRHAEHLKLSQQYAYEAREQAGRLQREET